MSKFFGMIRDALSKETDPNKVTEVLSKNYSELPIWRREDGMLMYQVKGKDDKGKGKGKAEDDDEPPAKGKSKGKGKKGTKGKPEPPSKGKGKSKSKSKGSSYDDYDYPPPRAGKGKGKDKDKGGGKGFNMGMLAKGMGKGITMPKGKGKGWDWTKGWGGKDWGSMDWGMDWNWTPPPWLWQQMYQQAFGGGKWGCGAKYYNASVTRHRISDDPVLGEVLEWKGQYAWVKPQTAIQHRAAKAHGGKVYVHKKDLCQPLTGLSQGQTVQFHVYEDQNGLGGEEVQLS